MSGVRIIEGSLTCAPTRDLRTLDEDSANFFAQACGPLETLGCLRCPERAWVQSAVGESCDASGSTRHDRLHVAAYSACPAAAHLLEEPIEPGPEARYVITDWIRAAVDMSRREFNCVFGLLGQSGRLRMEHDA